MYYILERLNSVSGSCINSGGGLGPTSMGRTPNLETDNCNPPSVNSCTLLKPGFTWVLKPGFT